MRQDAVAEGVQYPLRINLTIPSLCAMNVPSRAIGGAAQTAAADPSTYELDPSHTAIYFTVDQIGYS